MSHGISLINLKAELQKNKQANNNKYILQYEWQVDCLVKKLLLACLLWRELAPAINKNININKQKDMLKKNIESCSKKVHAVAYSILRLVMSQTWHIANSTRFVILYCWCITWHSEHDTFRVDLRHSSEYGSTWLASSDFSFKLVSIVVSLLKILKIQVLRRYDIDNEERISTQVI